MIDLQEHADAVLSRLRSLHLAVRDAVLRSRTAADDSSADDPAAVVGHASGDWIYRLDTHVEPVILDECRRWAADTPLVLVAEGIGTDGVTVLPESTAEADALLRIIVDPIDGTRGLMYDKRSAWCLTGVAPNRGPETRLSDIEVAMMSELPTSKQNRCDLLYAVRGQGTRAERHTLGGGVEPLSVRTSCAAGLAHGFAAVSSFFPGTKRQAACLMETIAASLVPRDASNTRTVFDDQYISTRGQLYELLAGHDRFLCDLRPLFHALAGERPGHCCHPYDLAALLVAQEAGVIITDGQSEPLDAPLDVSTNMSWIGYANETLRAAIEPVLRDWVAARQQEASP